ncbi:hypothetical protein GGI35DRAFT_493295 [Trichoderma velutinum]
MAMQQWAHAAKEYPEWWAQSHGDDLLLRRTKGRLRNEYDKSRNDKGKKRAIDSRQTFPAANSCEQWPSHHETLDAFSDPADVFNHMPKSSLESLPNNGQSISNSNLYPSSSMTSGQVWDKSMAERFPTVQGLLGTTSMPGLGQETVNAANTSTKYPVLESQPDIWTAYEPSQPTLAFEQVWGEGDGATQSGRPQHEVMQQIPNLNNVMLNLDDPFWDNMLAPSGEIALESGADTGEASSNNAVQLCDREVLWDKYGNMPERGHI